MSGYVTRPFTAPWKKQETQMPNSQLFSSLEGSRCPTLELQNCGVCACVPDVNLQGVRGSFAGAPERCLRAILYSGCVVTKQPAGFMWPEYMICKNVYLLKLSSRFGFSALETKDRSVGANYLLCKQWTVKVVRITSSAHKWDNTSFIKSAWCLDCNFLTQDCCYKASCLQ